MNEAQDDRWIGRMKETLENFSPADPPGDWKQLKRKINRSLPWYTRLLIFLRRPWIYAFIFGAGIFTGYLLFFQQNPSTMTGSPGPSGLSESRIEKPWHNTPAMATSRQANSSRAQSVVTEIPKGIHPEVKLHTNSLTSSLSPQEKSERRTPSEEHFEPESPEKPEPDLSLSAVHEIPAIQSAKEPHTTDTVTSPMGGPAQDDQTGGRSAKKSRNSFNLPSISIKGDPWKVGVGYEYQPMLQPDTGKGYIRGISAHFDKQVAPKLWLGTGIVFGKTGVERISKYWVRDWSRTDSLGTIYTRDSSVSYQRWQNHIAIPARLTYQFLRSRNFALPASFGATFGWAYNHSQILTDDGNTLSSYGGSTDGFTGFITADISLGYEVFYIRGLSAVLAVECRRMIAGPKSYGYQQNFIGGRILLNLDFDKKKWD